MKTILTVTSAIKSLAAAGLLLCLAGFTPDASAVVVKNLYNVEYPVPNQNRTVRSAVFRKGLEEVLIRVSGSRSVIQNITPGKASAYVQQFSYVEDTEDENSTGASSSTAKTSASDWYILKIQYNAGKIINLLRENGQPVWGEHRSEAVIWLAVRDGNNRYVLKKSDTSLLKDSVVQSSDRRGLPLVWPLYDSKDRKLLSFADVWAAFANPVNAASKRYTTGPSIVGRLSWTGSEWKGNWSVFVDNSSYSWSLSGSDYKSLISEGIDLSADMIGKHNAVLERADSGGPGLLVKVDNVDSIQAYRKIQEFLEGLTAVRQVSVAQVDKGSVAFHIHLRGNIDDFIRQVSIDKKLEPVVESIQPGGDANLQTVLRYIYRR